MLASSVTSICIHLVGMLHLLLSRHSWGRSTAWHRPLSKYRSTFHHGSDRTQKCCEVTLVTQSPPWPSGGSVHIPPLFQDLWVSDAGVGHVTVDSAPPFPAWSRPRTTSHCFIVTNPLISKWNVVHAALMARNIPVNKEISTGWYRI